MILGWFIHDQSLAKHWNVRMNEAPRTKLHHMVCSWLCPWNLEHRTKIYQGLLRCIASFFHSRVQKDVCGFWVSTWLTTSCTCWVVQCVVVHHLPRWATQMYWPLITLRDWEWLIYTHICFNSELSSAGTPEGSYSWSLHLCFWFIWIVSFLNFFFSWTPLSDWSLHTIIFYWI